ncbi:protein of unknown function [Candidatus Nitrotoga arctica]|uniref:Uncharacterized protein n=1 Tax=Candidatus Nitrotoga arctica TaxID=453162 RepID=A0ABM8Z205_9PROT|nr:protein of unknown function [Candidatus Nitrotoga arctica]
MEIPYGSLEDLTVYSKITLLFCTKLDIAVPSCGHDASVISVGHDRLGVNAVDLLV